VVRRRLVVVLVPAVLAAWFAALPSGAGPPVTSARVATAAARVPSPEAVGIAALPGFVVGRHAHGASGSTGKHAPAPAFAPAAVDAPATQLRVALGQLLAEHGFLVLEAIRGATLASPDAVAAKASLDRNSSELAAAFGGVYGSAAHDAFDRLWRTHVDLILDYARAKAGGDSAQMESDRSALDAYRVTFADFLARANPHLDANAEAEALRLHIEQLLAYTDSDFDRAYGAQRAVFEHMFMFGDDLALAITRQFPDRFPGANVAFAPAAELRITLDRLLGEHLVLTAEAMRALLQSAPDAPAAARAIEGNTAELSVAVANVYGSAAGSAFATAWKQHIDLYLRLIGNVAAGDATARASTQQSLVGAERAIVDFFAGAIPTVSRDGLAALVQEHVEGLIRELDAYATNDYPGAYDDVHDSYRHMFEIGKALAAGISAQFPDRFANLREIPATDTVEPSR
jgi:hypothetical protein